MNAKERPLELALRVTLFDEATDSFYGNTLHSPSDDYTNLSGCVPVVVGERSMITVHQPAKVDCFDSNFVR
jgi:hypothetical protein